MNRIFLLSVFLITQTSFLSSETIYLTCKGSWEKKGTSKVTYRTQKINESGSVFGELQILLMGSDIAASYSNKGKSRGSYMPEKCNANDTKVICNSGRKRMSSGAYYLHDLDFNYNNGNFNFTLTTTGNGVNWTERHYGNCQ